MQSYLAADSSVATPKSDADRPTPLIDWNFETEADTKPGAKRTSVKADKQAKSHWMLEMSSGANQQADRLAKLEKLRITLPIELVPPFTKGRLGGI
jgi:hypothetical protein